MELIWFIVRVFIGVMDELAHEVLNLKAEAVRAAEGSEVLCLPSFIVYLEEMTAGLGCM
jgi:hypothetical protein